MRIIVTVVLTALALCTGALANAGQSVIASCAVPDGYRLFPVEQTTPGMTDTTSGEPGSAGTVTITKVSSGKYDLQYRDRMREIFSLVGRGGLVTQEKSTASELVIYANYEGETEVFTFSKTTPETLRFTVISSSPGHERIEKKTNVVGSCSFVNFERG